ncbi:MAG: hypothetical protein RLZZ435_1018, partial [Cyanobacteriota bacterium]
AAVLELQKQALAALKASPAPLSIAALAEKIGHPEATETLYRILRHLDANDRWVVLEGERSKPGELRVRLK